MAISDLVSPKVRETLEIVALYEQANDEGLTDDSIVEFEDEQCRWGDLTLADRKAYFAGGYPF